MYSEEFVELLYGIIGIGIFLVPRPEIRRQARQTRRISDQIKERDRLVVEGLGSAFGGQIFLHRVGQLDLATRHRVRQQQRREHLGDGADLKDGVAVEGAALWLARCAVSDEVRAGVVPDQRDIPETFLPGVDPQCQQ